MTSVNRTSSAVTVVATSLNRNVTWGAVVKPPERTEPPELERRFNSKSTKFDPARTVLVAMDTNGDEENSHHAESEDGNMEELAALGGGRWPVAAFPNAPASVPTQHTTPFITGGSQDRPSREESTAMTKVNSIRCCTCGAHSNNGTNNGIDLHPLPDAGDEKNAITDALRHRQICMFHA